MLQQPMKEKLHALKLQGMIEALEHQEQDEATRGLNFLDRLALLVDQQWNWRQNQALTRRVLAARLRGTACVENIDLSCRARTEPERDPWVGPRVCLGGQPRTHLRAGSHRSGQKLCGFGTGAESLPGWLSGLLHEGRGAVPGSGHGAGRWQSAATIETAEPHRCSGCR